MAIFYAIATMSILYFAFGFYLEEYEPLVASMVYAQPCSPPFDLWFTNGDFMLMPPLAKIAEWIPFLPVYGLWLFSLNLLWLAGLIYLFLLIKNKTRDKRVLWFLPILIFGLLADSLVKFNYTRCGILLSVIALLLTEHDENAGKIKRGGYTLFFLLGTMSRMHAALIVFLFFMLYSFARGKNYLLFKRFIPHAIILVIILGIYHIDRLTTRHLGKIIESEYEYSISDKGALVPLEEMKTKVDSAKYLAVSRMLFTDTARITGEFLSKIVNRRIHYTDLISPDELEHGISILVKISKKYLAAVIMSLLPLIFSLHYFFSDKRKLLLRMIILQVFFWMLLFALSLSINMFERFFSPMLAALCVFSIMVYFQSPGMKRFGAMTLLCSMLAIFSCISLKRSTLPLKSNRTGFESTINSLSDYSKNYTVIAMGCIELLFSNNPFERLSQEHYSKILFPELTYFTYYRFGQQRTVEQYGFSPLDYRAFCKFLNANQNKILIYSENPESENSRIRHWQEYLDAVYGFQFSLKPYSPNQRLGACSLYRIFALNEHAPDPAF